MNFKDKVILITGASRGIGHYLANMFSEMGAKVIGIYKENIINIVLVDSYKCDITNVTEINKLFDYIKEEYKKIDIVVNCAAISMDSDITEKTKEEFMRVLEVNLVGPFLICKNAAKLMDKGVIINLSSTNASSTYNVLSMDYDASKAGLENLTKNLAVRYPNLKVCALAPNWVDTETTLSMEPYFLQEELKRVNQTRLITKKEVCNKIIELILSDDYKSGEIIRMDDSNE